MEPRAADVVYARGFKFTDPATRCFILNIAPGVSEMQLEKQLNKFGLVQVYTYQPATLKFPGWAWVGYYNRQGVNNLLNMSAAMQKVTAEQTFKVTSETPRDMFDKLQHDVDTVETSTTRVDTEPEAFEQHPEKQTAEEEQGP
ncbi:conserved hypothetical protein [Neospora caninum Liverpool]|uniref:Uncharacterized protein n=1 Tax=Neospora caninum (strain Liverpool) TaxID=572307 RepID=F0VHT4_NEOCL|nr:conserved hypothetical protein [Neospora caninum Liverpool]CBZ53295.1 conserved hypothetical protein [Neospora caninum Liverpool]CEL67281.1 TPA: hypothetical protein BN1204_030820 [Neospora caninum Liverpool]|eukprot:XP_003883327.1 conserved hypothetical protein [Neospora caninum Liverpool]